MPARGKELQQFEDAGQHHRDRRGKFAMLWIGEREGQSDRDEGEDVLANLAEIGVWPKARRSERYKGNGGGKQPGNTAR